MQPAGVHGTRRRRAGQQPAEVHRDAGRRRPSRARCAAMTSSSSMPLGSGSWSRMPWIARIGVERGDQCRAAPPARSPRGVEVVAAWRCRRRRPRASCCARRPARRDRRRPARRPAWARRRWSPRSAATPARTSAEHLLGHRLPSRINATAGSRRHAQPPDGRPRARSRDRRRITRRAARPGPWPARSGSASG